MNLHRLKTYINERVKESRRLAQSSLSRTHGAMAPCARAFRPGGRGHFEGDRCRTERR